MFTEEHLGRLEFSRAATALRGSLLAVLYSKTRCGCCREFYLPAACKGDRGFISKVPPGGGSLSHCLDALLRQLHVCFLAAFTGLTSYQVSLFKAASAKHCATFSQEGEVTFGTAQTLRPMSSLTGHSRKCCSLPCGLSFPDGEAQEEDGPIHMPRSGQLIIRGTMA